MPLAGIPQAPRPPSIASLSRSGGYAAPKKPTKASDRPKRLTIQQINAMGAEELKQNLQAVVEREDRRPAIVKVLDLIDIPRNVVANIANLFVGAETKERGALGLPKIMASDLLAKMGVGEGPARAITGFVGDVLLDPLTYVGAAAAQGGVKLAQFLPKMAPKIVKGIRGATKVAETAAKAGHVAKGATLAPDVAKALGLGKQLTEKGLGRVATFRKYAAEKVAKRIAAAKAAGEAIPKELIKRQMQLAKPLMGKRGGVIAEKLVKRILPPAGPGAWKIAPSKDALKLFAKYGEKGRKVVGIPFTQIGGPTLKVGARARKYRNVTEWLQGLESLAAAGPRAEGQAGLRHFLASVTSKQAREALLAASLAVKAAKVNDVAAWTIALSRVDDSIAQARKQVDGFENVYKQSIRAVKPSERPVLQSQVSKGLAKKIRAAREDLSTATQAREYLENMAPKYGVPLGGRQAAKGRQLEAMRGLAETGREVGRSRLAVAKQGLRKATKTADFRAKQLAKADVELMRHATSQEAPGLVKEFMRAKGLSDPHLRGHSGLWNRAVEFKRRLFGMPRSEMHSRFTGIRAQYGSTAQWAGAQAGSTMARKVNAIAQRLMTTPEVRAKLAAEGIDKIDDLKALMYWVTEAGPNATGAAVYQADDAIRSLVEQARRVGVVDDPEFAGLLGEINNTLGSLTEVRNAAGIDAGRIENYIGRPFTKEGSQVAGMQKMRVGPKPGKQLGGRLQLPRPEQVARARVQTWQMPDGRETKILSTSRDVDRFEAMEGATKIAEGPISAAELDRLAREGKLKDLFGPIGMKEWPDLPKTGMIEPDIAKAYGTSFAQHERSLATKNLQTLVEDYGVNIPDAGIGYKRYGHLAKPAKPKPGGPFDELAQVGLFDKAYPVAIADSIDEMVRVWNSAPAIEQLVGATDKVLGFWKTMQLYSPAYVIRNVWQNFFGGIMAGANPMRVAEFWKNKQARMLRAAVVKNSRESLSGATIALRSGDMPLDALYDVLHQFPLVGTGSTAAQMPVTPFGRAGSEYVSKALGAAKGAGHGVKTAVFRANQWVEDMQKLGTWLHFIDSGMDPKNAAIRTLVAMPDLTDLTLWERNIARRILPWWSWMRRNGSLQLFHYLPRKPAYAAVLPKFKNFLEGLRGAGNVPEDLRPEWMQEQFGAQITGDEKEGNVFLPSTWFPFEEMYQALAAPVYPGETSRRVVESLRPEIRAMYELGTGVNTFRGEPYAQGNRISTLDLLKAFPRALAGRSGTQMDVLAALRPVREWGPGGRVSQMPTATGKALRLTIGGAVQPVEKKRGLATEYVRLRDLVRRLRSGLNRAVEAKDEARAKDLALQLTRALRRMHELGLPGVTKTTGKMFEQHGIEAGQPAFE